MGRAPGSVDHHLTRVDFRIAPVCLIGKSGQYSGHLRARVGQRTLRVLDGTTTILTAAFNSSTMLSAEPGELLGGARHAVVPIPAEAIVEIYLTNGMYAATER
jgi:hypothetical protein